MAKKDIRVYSREDIRAMEARGEVRSTRPDAPEIHLDENFWKNARIVKTRPDKK